MVMMISYDSSNLHEKNSSRSPTVRARSRRCRQIRTGTAVFAFGTLLLATTAWLSLVFSGNSNGCWRRFSYWEGSPVSQSLHWRKHQFSDNNNNNNRHRHHHSIVAPQGPVSFPDHYDDYSNRNRNLSEEWDEEELSLKHIMFGIAGSSQLWKRRKELVRLWWRPDEMRGHVWLEDDVTQEEGDDVLPALMISEDISRFRYTNPTGHPSGLRISRIVVECFRLRNPNVRWFVLGDDDTIFNADNLVTVLSKYDPAEMVYVGSPSESHSANSYFSHSMAFGGGGIAISYPLAEALSDIHDDCIERYPTLYGSDDRLHACITELGVPLSREHGFHQYDIKGSAHGLMSSHPVAPFVSIHHVEAVNPFYPGLDSLDSLKLFSKAMTIEPRSFLQRSICYAHSSRLTFSVSLGYVVQVFPNVVLPRDLERSEQTYSAWNGLRQGNEFDLDIRDPYSSVCRKPVLYFLKDVGMQGNATIGSYLKASAKDDLKRKVLCFPRSPPLPNVQTIQVLGCPLKKNWHLAPRRLCCSVNQTSKELVTLTVGQCDKESFSSITALMIGLRIHVGRER